MAFARHKVMARESVYYQSACSMHGATTVITATADNISRTLFLFYYFVVHRSQITRHNWASVHEVYSCRFCSLPGTSESNTFAEMAAPCGAAIFVRSGGRADPLGISWGCAS